MSNRVSKRLEYILKSAWRRRDVLAHLLLPLTLCFAFLAGMRRHAYRVGWLRQYWLAVPVVVVGNISVGGSGKTPLVLWLAQEMAKLGWHPGIVSRGYKGSARLAMLVKPDSDPGIVGDEPLLLARRAGCQVWIGRDRVATACALFTACPACDIILSDDGLQHYRLGRDLEIVVLDQQGLGNAWLLPAGPLRESVNRVAQVDAVVLNALDALPEGLRAKQSFRMSLVGTQFYSLAYPRQICTADDLQGRSLHAVAGIGHPERFFQQLEALGLHFEAHAFPDHHHYKEADLRVPEGHVLLMTEKDAVKCSRLALSVEVWVLPVTAVVAPNLAQWITKQLKA